MTLSDGQIGALAALAAALCWVFTSLAFAAAGRRVGPTAVNLIRILLAVVVLAAVHRVAFGTWAPRVDRVGLAYLAVSGVIGLALGDQLLFTALVDVGPRLASLLMTLAPPAAALLAWPVLDEPLGLLAVMGMAVTLAGIGLVVLERPRGAAPTAHRRRGRGIALGLGAAVCQGAGLVLAKLGIGHTRLPVEAHLDPWSATLVRMVFAAVVLALVTSALRARRPAARLDATIEVSPETEHLPPAPSDAGRSVWPRALVLIVIGA
ncbi:MAG: EamA family transporter, partial [Planctomycetota bacterium]